ncbi:MAG: hypothetical protein QOJ86_3036 [Bradyrhizobium sp.]|jgi:hypothetical protein|nr:hypothetical protein [Bradyrhizobium sp.]
MPVCIENLIHVDKLEDYRAERQTDSDGHANRRWQMSYYRLPIASLLPSIHARHNFQVRL